MFTIPRCSQQWQCCRTGCISGLTTAQLAIECDESPHAVPVAISLESRRKFFFRKSAAWAKQQRRFRSFLLFFSGKGPIAPVQYSCMQAPGPIWAPHRNLQFLTFISLVSNHLCIFRQNISYIILPPGFDTGFTVSFDTRGLGSGRWETQKTPNLDD